MLHCGPTVGISISMMISNAGSIALMTQPIASLASGWFTDTLGRRRTMILVNVPHIAAWLLMYMATTTIEIYAAGVLLGIGVGLMETSVITYVGEISHQSIRGILLALSNLSGMLGIVTMYLAGALASWRNVALMCLAVPILAVGLICLVSSLVSKRPQPSHVDDHPPFQIRADTGNSVLAADPRSRCGRTQVTAVAAWLGSGTVCSVRIR